MAKNNDGAPNTEACLYHNDEKSCCAYDNEGHSYHHAFGCTAHMHLRVGDRAYVKFERGTIVTNGYTSFTGAMIHPL